MYPRSHLTPPFFLRPTNCTQARINSWRRAVHRIAPFWSGPARPCRIPMRRLLSRPRAGPLLSVAAACVPMPGRKKRTPKKWAGWWWWGGTLTCLNPPVIIIDGWASSFSGPLRGRMDRRLGFRFCYGPLAIMMVRPSKIGALGQGNFWIPAIGIPHGGFAFPGKPEAESPAALPAAVHHQATSC